MSEGSFLVLDPTNPQDLEAWVNLWSHTSHREVQAHPSYGMAVTPDSEQLLGAVAATSAGTAILPFAVRPIPIRSARGARDAITPYGYGGAFLDGRVDADWFWGRWDAWAADNDLAGITLRCHLFDDEVLPVTGTSVHPLTNVVIDLEQSEEQIWAGYEGRVRTDVRRGRSLGVEITIDDTCSGLAEFHDLYSQTMAAKGADDFYSFDLARLEAMVAGLGSGVALFHAHVDGHLVATEMQLVGGRNAYYFLSGSSDEGRRSSANPVMKHEVVMWLKARGLQRYVLGGGMRRQDSLFRYKRAYSPRNTREFTVTFHEAMTGAASDLIASRRQEESGWTPTPGFIPEYRAPAATDGEPT